MVKDHSDSRPGLALWRKERKKEMFYLTTHSTHFIYGYMAKDHSDSERGNLLPPHGRLFPFNSKGFFYMHHPTDRIAHTTAFVTPVVVCTGWNEK